MSKILKCAWSEAEADEWNYEIELLSGEKIALEEGVLLEKIGLYTIHCLLIPKDCRKYTRAASTSYLYVHPKPIIITWLPRTKEVFSDENLMNSMYDNLCCAQVVNKDGEIRTDINH